MQSRLFKRGLIPTTRESSRLKILRCHDVLLRGGYVTAGGSSGLFNLLPLGQRVIQRITRVVVDELENIGSQRITLPSLIDAQHWKQSGRWDSENKELIKVIDRHQHEYVLAPTSEEAVVHLAKQTLSSYNQLPLTLFQVTTKWRDEKRPRGGLLRSREFLMKDAYSFHWNEGCADDVYALMRDAYQRIFDRLELPVVRAQGDSGDIGGSFSEEYHFLSESGEDVIIRCNECGTAWNTDLHAISCGCTRATTSKHKSIEVAHLFQLGDKYSKPMELLVQGPASDERKNPLMNCYGIGVSRILQTLVEASMNATGDSLVWPEQVAPYDTLIICDDKLDARVIEKWSAGDTLVDDRKRVSIGRKLKDSQLLGIPNTYVFGKTYSQKSQVEMIDRHGAVSLISN